MNEKVEVPRKLKVAVVGCCHGELDQIYGRFRNGEVVADVLVICGDFQACRNEADLACMACPDKYKAMHSFYRYYTGESVAPCLTIVIGGNHEASNYMQELFYGGWVAPKIYYLGAAGCVKVGGIRIAGLSGIYNEHRWNANSDRYEHPPYTPSSMRSAYHVRPLQVKQLELLTGNVDVFLSHDWPLGIEQHGNLGYLLRRKPFFKKEVDSNTLGSPPAGLLLDKLQPSHWFSAHLHVRFEALVSHQDDHAKTTKFLALDKCLPGRKYIEVVEVDTQLPSDAPITLEYDPEWLSILKATHQLVAEKPSKIPNDAVLQISVADAKLHVEDIFAKRELKYEIHPSMFVKTMADYNPRSFKRPRLSHRPQQQGNPQTDELLRLLDLEHIRPVTIPYANGSVSSSSSTSGTATKDDNEIDLDDL